MRLLVVSIVILLIMGVSVAWLMYSALSIAAALKPLKPQTTTAPVTQPVVPARVETPPPHRPATSAPATLPADAATDVTPVIVRREVPADAATQPATTAPTTRATVGELRTPQDPEPRRARARLELARAALVDDPYNEAALRDAVAACDVLGEPWAAVDALERLCELYPDDGELRLSRAAVLLRLQRNVEAIAELNTLVTQTPDNAAAWFNLAVAHQAAGHLSDALHAWDAAIALQPNAECLARRGEVRADLGDWAGAEADFWAVVALEPTAQDATLNLALALTQQTRYTAARDVLQTFLETQPESVVVLNRLIEVGLASPDATALREELRGWCTRSLTLAPNQPWVRAALDALSSDADAARR